MWDVLVSTDLGEGTDRVMSPREHNIHKFECRDVGADRCALTQLFRQREAGQSNPDSPHRGIPSQRHSY